MFSKIRDNLFLSSAVDITDERIIENNIDLILNVSDNSNALSNKVEKIKIAFADSSLAAKEKAKEAISFLIQSLKEGKIVVVHCKQGASRSPHVVAAAISIIEDKNYHEVYNEVIRLHPRTMCYSIGRELEDRYGKLFIS